LEYSEYHALYGAGAASNRGLPARSNPFLAQHLFGLRIDKVHPVR